MQMNSQMKSCNSNNNQHDKRINNFNSENVTSDKSRNPAPEYDDR
jgi:hypothetical protein